MKNELIAIKDAMQIQSSQINKINKYKQDISDNLRNLQELLDKFNEQINDTQKELNRKHDLIHKKKVKSAL